jgi:5-hydroxyisourate hydrolase-like protein (transthyretin family)
MLGVQEVWVMYTGLASSSLHGKWVALDGADFTQNADEPSEWGGTLTTAKLKGTDPSSVRFFVQAVNAVGMVTIDTNSGTFYQPDQDPADLSLTDLETEDLKSTQISFTAPISGSYGSEITIVVTLLTLDSQKPIVGETVSVSLGDLSYTGVTDSNGQATIVVQLVTIPDDDLFDIQVDYSGSSTYDEAFSRQSFSLGRQTTSMAFQSSASAQPGADFGLKLTLTDSEGRVVPERFIRFVFTNVKTKATYVTTAGTNSKGKVFLNKISGKTLPLGTYTVEATFNEDDYYLGDATSTNLEIGYWVYLPLIFR